MEHTRHRVFTEEVVDLTSCELLDPWMSASGLNGEEGCESPGIYPSYLWLSR